MRQHLAAMQAILSLVSAGALLIPKPQGTYGTNVAVTALTDTSRLDPFSPKPANRSMVISVFYPAANVSACDWSNIPAYPPITAATFDTETAFAGVPNGSFERIRLQTCSPKSSSDAIDLSDVPIVTFSPGLGTGRLWYSALAQAVSSFGYVVVTIDTPYDSNIVEFPDGQIIWGLNISWNYPQSLTDVRLRARNMAFVLEELGNSDVVDNLFGSKTTPPRSSGLKANQAGVFGHSLGGATAAMAMYFDPKFVGGINLDGGMYGKPIHEGLKEPFMLFGHLSNSTARSWPVIWQNLNWKLNIEILNSTHTTFTDIPLLSDLIFGQPLPSFVQEIVGYIPGERARDIIAAYVVAFMDMVLKCEPQSLLQRPSPEYPEIVFEAEPA